MTDNQASHLPQTPETDDTFTVTVLIPKGSALSPVQKMQRACEQASYYALSIADAIEFIAAVSLEDGLTPRATGVIYELAQACHCFISATHEYSEKAGWLLEGELKQLRESQPVA